MDGCGDDDVNVGDDDDDADGCLVVVERNSQAWVRCEATKKGMRGYLVDCSDGAPETMVLDLGIVVKGVLCMGY